MNRSRYRIPRAGWLLSVPLLLATLGGCARGPSANDRLNNWMAAQQAQLPQPEYHVEPPDELLIVAPKVKELDGQKRTVRPDGRITLNLLGELDVNGKTPEQIAQLIRRAALKFYDRGMLDITVQVSEFKSKTIYVFGQVREPGVKPYTGRDTVLGVLAAAQLNNSAWPRKVVVVRPNEDPAVRQKITIDLKRVFETGNTTHDYLLENGDLVYVPPDPMAQMSATFDKLLVPMRAALNVASLATFGI